jgi:hypothetical protein
MMELRPGVGLNEGGKTYGGLSYNVYRVNQQDLLSYQKSKDDSAGGELKKTVETLRRIKQMQFEE